MQHRPRSIGKLIFTLCVFVAACGDAVVSPEIQEAPQQRERSEMEVNARAVLASLQNLKTIEDAKALNQTIAQLQEQSAITHLDVQRVAYPCDTEKWSAIWEYGLFLGASGVAASALVAGGGNPYNPLFVAAAAAAAMQFGSWVYVDSLWRDCLDRVHYAGGGAGGGSTGGW